MAILSASALLPLTACSASESGPADSASAHASASLSQGPAAQAPTAGSTVDAAQFAAAIRRPGVTILDVRTPEEFAAGHLDGALNIDVNGAGFDAAIEQLPADGEYAVYCRSGNRSATALARMKQLGRASAYHLGGGIGAWQDAGLPLVK